MKKTHIFSILLVVLLPAHAFSQSTSKSAVTNSGKLDIVDTLSYLYNGFNKLYSDFTKQEGTVYNLNSGVNTLQKDFNSLNSLLDENTKAVQKVTKDVNFTYRTQYYIRRKKIINTAGFVESANASLNSIILLDKVTDYLGEITSLNSPENKDLGFSLSNEIQNILGTKIIKGKPRINGGKSSKVIEFVDNILKSPVTGAISNAVPVVASIKSVVDLIMGAAVTGEDVSVNEVAEFKAALEDYIRHYEGLALAQDKFDNTLNTLKVRKVALSQLLRQYTIERVNTLDPGSIANNDTSSLTSIINKKYTKEIIEDLIEVIESKNGIPTLKVEDKGLDDIFSKGLDDKKMGYPTYAESQARFIRDEILAISNEYITAYKEYQNTIESVLNETLKKNIGKQALVEKKTKTLRTKLGNVINAFNSSINADQLNKKFYIMIELL
jgi:hypothetical protein